MTTATVRYITNGYTVNWQGSQAIGVPASLYAGSIAEAVYWLGRIFDPVAQPAAPAPPAARALGTPRTIDNTDPLLGQQAQVIDIASGGFLVTQQPSALTGGLRMIEVYCVDMDAVHAVLAQIYTPPPPLEDEEALRFSSRQL